MVDGARLDCISDDLALLLAARGVEDVQAVFGQDWRFDLRQERGSLPRPALPPADQGELLGQRTGWQPRWRRATSPRRDAQDWRDELSAGNAVVVVGDAYHLPWLPYAGHEHMAHGFVIEGLSWDNGAMVAHIVDPYDNITQWGHAQPLTTRQDLDSLGPGLADGRWAVLVAADQAPPADPGQQVTANAAAIAQAAESGAYQRFIDAHQRSGIDEMRNLALATWLLARNRALHACWLAALPAWQAPDSLAERFGAEISAGWRRATEMCYIASRRLLSGHAAPPAAIRSVQQVAAAEVSLARSVLSSAEREPRRGQQMLTNEPADATSEPADVCQ
jgi:Butirosin biosynthesis protein H, N-terminal